MAAVMGGIVVGSDDIVGTDGWMRRRMNDDNDDDNSI